MRISPEEVKAATTPPHGGAPSQGALAQAEPQVLPVSQITEPGTFALKLKVAEDMSEAHKTCARRDNQKEAVLQHMLLNMRVIRSDVQWGEPTRPQVWRMQTIAVTTLSQEH